MLKGLVFVLSFGVLPIWSKPVLCVPSLVFGKTSSQALGYSLISALLPGLVLEVDIEKKVTSTSTKSCITGCSTFYFL